MMTEAEEIFFTHYVEYIDKRLRRFFVKIIIMFSFLGLTCGVLGYYVYKSGENNQTALCAQKRTAQSQIEQADQYLKENPTGAPGISREQILRSKGNSVRTAKALKAVNCD